MFLGEPRKVLVEAGINLKIEELDRNGLHQDGQTENMMKLIKNNLSKHESEQRKYEEEEKAKATRLGKQNDPPSTLSLQSRL